MLTQRLWIRYIVKHHTNLKATITVPFGYDDFFNSNRLIEEGHDIWSMTGEDGYKLGSDVDWSKYAY